MAKVNFKQFKLFTSITRERSITCDVSREVADLLYRQGAGIAMHDLAFRIFRSENEMTLSDEDIRIIQVTAKQMCSPAFIDSFEANLIND